MLRLGLCCIFREEPIRFRTTTAKALLRSPREEQLAKVSALCLANAKALLSAVTTVQRLGIGAFRVLSPILPRYTHPDVGYCLDGLPAAADIRRSFAEVKAFSETHGIRLSFHPDQFVCLSSPRPDVVEKSKQELEYQALVAESIGAREINIHGGGAYGDKEATLIRFRRTFAELSPAVRQRLTLENDDITYTPTDLLPVCQDLGIPLVYDVHHHRCLPDGVSVAEATALASESWQRLGHEPRFHLSSPKSGWKSGMNPKPHADYIDPRDVPREWLDLTATVDIEAKAKELAILRLMRDLNTTAGTSVGISGKR